MSDSLDADYRDWPADPYRLLGIERDADERAARSAYHRLIRRFTPEQSPDEFMRVRAAYEHVRQLLEYRRQAAHWEADDDEADDEPDAATVAPPARSKASQSEPHVEPTPISAVKIAWQQAIAGDRSGAYRALVALAGDVAGRDASCVPLMWLLRVDPGLDADRSPKSWLLAAIRDRGPHSSAWEPYQTLIDADPEESLSAETTDVLWMTSDISALRPMLEIRWRTAADREQWELIRSDWDRLAHARASATDPVQLELAMLVLDHAAWSYHPGAKDLFEDAFAVLNRFAAHDSPVNFVFDRYYLLADLTEWYRTSDSPWLIWSSSRDLLTLLRRSWTEPAERLRTPAIAVVERWIDEPQRALETLEGFDGYFHGSLGLLHGLFRRLSTDEHDDVEDGATPLRLVNAVRRLNATAMQVYEQFRNEVLRLAIDEGLHVEDLTERSSAATMDAHWAGWCHVLHGDMPLRVLTAAFRAYWS